MVFAGVIVALFRFNFATKEKVAITAMNMLSSPSGTTIDEIGKRLLTDYILPFEMASILLLSALVGAAYIARRGDEARREGRRATEISR